MGKKLLICRWGAGLLGLGLVVGCAARPAPPQPEKYIPQYKIYTLPLKAGDVVDVYGDAPMGGTPISKIYNGQKFRGLMQN